METATAPVLSAEDESKDALHLRLAALCDEMTAAHGRDFKIGRASCRERVYSSV